MPARILELIPEQERAAIGCYYNGISWIPESWRLDGSWQDYDTDLDIVQ